MDVITRAEAVKLLPDGIEMDPYFPNEAHCSKEHIRHMFRGPVPMMATSRNVLVGQTSMSTYPIIGIYAVGDRDPEHMGPGHVFLLGKPGTGKTLVAKIPGQVIGGKVSRFQGAPDSLPADYIGTRVIQVREDGGQYFELVKGPAFADIQLHDEVTRNTPRMLSALLQVLGEGKITVGNETYDVGPFAILTANYTEEEGTYELPNALKDRIMFQVIDQNFTAEEFAKILEITQDFHKQQFKQVCTVEDVKETRLFFHETIRVSDEIRLDFMGRFAEISNRPHEFGFLNDLADDCDGVVIRSGLSGRGVPHWEGAARAMAAFRYRNYVTPDDVYKVLLPILRHRTVFSPGVLQYFRGKWNDPYIIVTRDKILKQLIQEAWL